MTHFLKLQVIAFAKNSTPLYFDKAERSTMLINMYKNFHDSYVTHKFRNPSNSVPQTQQRVPQQGGLQVQTLDGPANCRRKVKPGDNIVVHYHGTLTDGTVFDSSYQRNQPFNVQIGVGNVIQGWDQGIVGMCPGEKRRLIIPPELAYGQTVKIYAGLKPALKAFLL